MASEQFKFEVTLFMDKNAELFSDILDLWIDAMAASYSTFRFKHQDVTGDYQQDNQRTTAVTVTDPEDNGKEYKATAATVAQGLVLMLADDGTPRQGAGNMAQSYVPSIDSDNPAPARRVALGLLTGEYDAGTIDAGDADCIMQLGLLGTVQYG